ncbi:MAG: alanine racemase [Candidatus Gracilibacteria bacterium]|nr:alanine racemase [Candidatus Gracilibacteria bacterium]
MKLNTDLLEKIRNSDSRLVAVTKYADVDDTLEVLDILESEYLDILEGIGENRVESLIEKNIDREKVHFIGNIQSKQIKDIIKYASVVHSLDDIKHIRKFEDICAKSGNWIQIFLQINVDKSKPGGITVEKIPEYLELIGDMENVSLVGFSAIGKSEFTRQEKEAEFDLLISLRNKYLPNGFVSAGTSVDYEIALEKGVDIVRIGSELFNI